VSDLISAQAKGNATGAGCPAPYYNWLISRKKKRRSRSGTAQTPDEVAKMTLPELEQKILHARWLTENASKSQLRKLFFKRLIWLERQREEIFGIPAPERTLPRQ